MAFYDAIHEKYPNITIIASNTDYLPDPAPEGIWIDNHTYSAPSELVEFFTMWDDADRSIPVFVGEYACKWRDDGSGMPLPEMQGSVAEAVFLIGIERNSDVVKMAAYAPLLQNIEGTQWEVSCRFFSSPYITPILTPATTNSPTSSPSATWITTSSSQQATTSKNSSPHTAAPQSFRPPPTANLGPVSSPLSHSPSRPFPYS